MKKTLLASAVIGMLAAPAWAQSEATLYGTLDVGYGVGNQGIYEGAATGNGKFQQWGGSKATSVWGLKGSEDLGNGLKAYFQLESEINPEDGASEGFNRAAFVGLAGNFGAIQAGRQSTVASNIMSEFDVSGAPALTSSLGNAGVSGDAQRFADGTYDHADSVIAYVSPEFSGFSFQAAVILKNDDAFGLDGMHTSNDIWGNPLYASAKTIYTIGAMYSYGDFTIGAVYESKPASMPGTDISASWGIGAKYDFGSFLVSASYFDNHLKNDGRGFSLGIAAPISNTAFTVGAQVAYNMKAYSGTETKYAWIPSGSTWVPYAYDTDREVKPLAWELFATYDLSKRTQLYVQYGGTNNDAETFNAAERKYSASIGMIHNF